MPDEEAVLNLKRERVLHWDKQESAAQLLRIELGHEPADNLHPCGLVAVERRTDIGDWPRLAAADDHQRKFNPATVCEFSNPNPLLSALATINMQACKLMLAFVPSGHLFLGLNRIYERGFVRQ